MNIQKICIRLAVFLCTLTIAFLVARPFLVPPRGAVRVTTPAAPTLTAPLDLPTRNDGRAQLPAFVLDAQLIELDRAARRAHVRLAVERVAADAAVPASIWVWTYFFSPDAPGQVWAGDPVEVRAPFARGDRVTLNVTSACAWCADETSALPRNFYARTSVSFQSAAAARLPFERLDFDIKLAKPVMVSHALPR